MSVKRKGDHLSDEQRNKFLSELIHFFEVERGEIIGRIAAEQVLNFFLESIGADLYNKGIGAAKKALTERFDELQYDLDDLLDE